MSSTAFSIEQMDTWTKATEDGKRLLKELLEGSKEQEGELAAARKAEQAKLPQLAAERYTQVIAKLQQVVQTLQIPAELPHEHAAIRNLSTDARKQRDEAQQLLTKLQEEGVVAKCRAARQRAEALLQEARQAIEQGDRAEARNKAIEANELDRSLSDDADVIKRAADTEVGEQSNQTGLIAVGVILLILLILAGIFGPGLWAWISEFLFPATALALPPLIRN